MRRLLEILSIQPDPVTGGLKMERVGGAIMVCVIYYDQEYVCYLCFRMWPCCNIRPFYPGICKMWLTCIKSVISQNTKFQENQKKLEETHYSQLLLHY